MSFLSNASKRCLLYSRKQRPSLCSSRLDTPYWVSVDKHSQGCYMSFIKAYPWLIVGFGTVVTPQYLGKPTVGTVRLLIFAGFIVLYN